MTRQRKSSKRKYTYADNLTWPEDERWELIDGQPFDMTPAPSPLHQEISVALEKQFLGFLEGHSCKLYHAI